MRIFTIVLAFLVGAVSPREAFATCLDDAAAFSERVCGELSNRGSSQLVTGSGELTAEARGLVARMLGSAQGSAAVSGAVSTYENVTREQLATDHANVRECRERMVDVAIKQVCKQGAENNGSPTVGATSSGVASGPPLSPTPPTEQESKRRHEILDRLSQEFIASPEGRCPTLGDPWFANRWANKRLLQMGENWQLPIGTVVQAQINENYIYGGCNRIDVQAGTVTVNGNHMFSEDNSISVGGGKAEVNNNEMHALPMLPQEQK
jgi:hypothetical protein